MMFHRKNKHCQKTLQVRASEAADQLEKQKPKVNNLTSWLEDRKNQNGFGEDFEYTLRPRRAS